MTDRDFWLEVYRGIGHIMKGFGTISAAIARRYALGEREATTSTRR